MVILAGDQVAIVQLGQNVSQPAWSRNNMWMNFKVALVNLQDRITLLASHSQLLLDFKLM